MPENRICVTCWSYLALAIDKPYMAGHGVIIHEVLDMDNGHFGYIMSNDWNNASALRNTLDAALGDYEPFSTRNKE